MALPLLPDALGEADHDLSDRDVLPASLIPMLAAYPELSTLSKYINGSTEIADYLNSFTNFTFLAPDNDAWSAWNTANGNSTPSVDTLKATLSYHMINGSYPSASFTNESQFIATNLDNASYSNVTIYPGAQRVELTTAADGTPEFLSSNKTVSTITMKDVICLNGLIQIVSNVLTIPIALVTLTAQANMSYLIAILNRANFLALDNAGIIDFVNTASFTPNLTFFAPNSAVALATFTNATTDISANDLLNLFNYHIVPNFVGYSTTLRNGTVVKTLQGENLTITRDGEDGTSGDIYVNGAKIINPDYMVVNGVIHEIDNLLLSTNTSIPAFIPRASTTSAPTSSTSSSSGLSTGALAAAIVVPIVAVLALAALAFWFFRNRKQKKEIAEIDSRNAGKPPGELSGPEAKEMHEEGKTGELDGTKAPVEMDPRTPPTELPSHNMNPVELP